MVLVLNANYYCLYPPDFVIRARLVGQPSIYMSLLHHAFRFGTHHETWRHAVMWTWLSALRWECWDQVSLNWYGLMLCAGYLLFGNGSELNRNLLYVLFYALSRRGFSRNNAMRSTSRPCSSYIFERIDALPLYHSTTVNLVNRKGSRVLNWPVSKLATCADGVQVIRYS